MLLTGEELVRIFRFTYSDMLPPTGDSAATYSLCEEIGLPIHEHIAYTLTLNPNNNCKL